MESWCLSKPDITLLPDKSKIRPVIGKWSSVDIVGKPLLKTQLSGSLLRVQGFRGTICNVKEFDYLVKKNNGVVQIEVEAALFAKADFESKVETLIRKLTWKDFELLIDLIFRQAGWQRMSYLGKTEKTVDLDLQYPITQERFLVQVKSSAGKKQLQTFQERWAEFQDYDRAYFVVHAPLSDLPQVSDVENITIWLLKDIARQTIVYGLADWVIEKVR